MDNMSADGSLQNGFVSTFKKYLDVEEITSEIMADVLQEVRIFPDGRIETVWNWSCNKRRLPPAVLHGGDALQTPEALGEVAQRGKSQDLRDLGDAVVRLPQKEAALLDTAGNEVADGGGAELLLKGVGQVVLVDVGHLRQLVQRQVFLKVVVDVAPDQVALPAGAGTGRLAGENDVPLTAQADQHHLQQVLADGLVVRQGLRGLLKHQAQAEEQFLPSGVEVQHGVSLRSGQGLKALHAQHGVLQRTLQLTDFGVGDIGVDHHHIPDRHGDVPLPGTEAAMSAGDEEYLGAAVGVEAGVPVLAVLGVSGVEELSRPARAGRSAGGASSGAFPKRVLPCAHGHRLPSSAIF